MLRELFNPFYARLLVKYKHPHKGSKRERNEREPDMLADVATTGEKLVRLRRGQGLTQAELSDASGVAQSTIAQI